MKKILWLSLIILVSGHHVLLFAFLLSFFILPFYEPWYVATPLMAFIFFFITNPVQCRLTDLENFLRKKLELRRIGSFVGHYFLKPYKIFMAKRKH